MSVESQKRKAVFRLGTRLLQVAQHSTLDEAALRVYLNGLKRQYAQEMELNTD